MNVAMFTDNDCTKLNDMTATLRAVVEHAPADMCVRVYSEHALPATYTAIEHLGSVTTTVVRLSRGVDTSVLQPPASRFPHYQTIDLAEWLEHR